MAQHVSRRVLTLPLYADLEMEDVDRICGIILDCRKKQERCFKVNDAALGCEFRVLIYDIRLSRHLSVK